MNTSTDRKITPWGFLTVLFIGGIIIGTYYALAFFGVSGIGQTTDIGGGILLLFGCAVAGIGIIGGIIKFVVNIAGAERNRHEDSY